MDFPDQPRLPGGASVPTSLTHRGVRGRSGRSQARLIREGLGEGYGHDVSFGLEACNRRVLMAGRSDLAELVLAFNLNRAGGSRRAKPGPGGPAGHHAQLAWSDRVELRGHLDRPWGGSECLGQVSHLSSAFALKHSTTLQPLGRSRVSSWLTTFWAAGSPFTERNSTTFSPVRSSTGDLTASTGCRFSLVIRR